MQFVRFTNCHFIQFDGAHSLSLCLSIETISNLEEETAAIRESAAEINSSREQHGALAQQQQDADDIEMELNGERQRTKQLKAVKSEIEEALNAERDRVRALEQKMREYEEHKVELAERANEQMNQLRDYLLFYQQYFNEQRARREQKERGQTDRERERSEQSAMKRIFG